MSIGIKEPAVYKLIDGKKGHWLLGLVKLCDLGDSVVEIAFVKNQNIEEDLHKRVYKAHRYWNHKSVRNMELAYKAGGYDTKEVRKIIEEVVRTCEVCQRRSRSFSIPKVSMALSKTVNDVVTMDLKIWKRPNLPILWMIDSFSRFVVGAVLKDKGAEEVSKKIEAYWKVRFTIAVLLGG